MNAQRRLPARLRPAPLGPIVWMMAAVLLCACTPPPAPAPEPLAVRGPAGDLPARRLEVVAQALAMTGQPYRLGGAAPGGFDCSGLVSYAYAQAGFRLPRRAIEQAERARRLPPQALQPGDLLFFRIDGTISHVGIYMGDGRMVHAPSSGKTVRIDTIDAHYWAPRYAGAIPMQQLLADAS